jgi:DNA-binding Lrp family transcriptional regulator
LQGLDEIQIRIMNELASPRSFRWDIRESYASIAERLRVDEETVRRRVKRARESGFLKGWKLFLNPHLIGLESTGIQLDIDDEERKAAVISQVERMDGVVILIDFHSRALRIILYYENESDLERKTQQIKSICGNDQLLLWKGGFPASDQNMKRTDWEIVKAFRKDPRRSPSKVADEVGVSTRTIKRRLTAMTQNNSIFMLPALNYDKSLGVACDFLIICPDETKRSEVNKQMRAKLDRVVFSFTEAKGFSIFALMCLNLSESEEIHKWIKGMDGVSDVRADIMRGNILVDKWLDEEIEKQLSEHSVG